jgi:hypothetical protein
MELSGQDQNRLRVTGPAGLRLCTLTPEDGAAHHGTCRSLQGLHVTPNTTLGCHPSLGITAHWRTVMPNSVY